MAEFIAQSVAVGLDPNHVEFTFKDPDGQERRVAFKADQLAEFMLIMETGAADLFEMAKAQLKGFDPRLIQAIPGLSCRKIDVGGTSDGRVVLMITTDRGMCLNLGMDQARAAALSERIAAQIQDLKAGPAKSN